MDWCLNIYEEWRMAAYVGVNRTLKMLLAVLVFCMVLLSVSAHTESDEFPAYEKNAMPAAGGMDAEALTASAVFGCMVIPEIPEAVSEELTENTQETAAAMAVPDTSHIQESLIAADKPIVTDISAESDAPEVPDASIAPDISAEEEKPAVPEMPIVPDASDEPDAPVISAPPAAADDVESTLSASGTVGGFAVDENGFICGVSDPELAISGGVMSFPAEGCSGIRAGAFSEGFPSVLEVCIPMNITQIEAGAFAGLENVEWYTAEPGSGFSDKMGVLLSDNGATVFAFPSGRTGSYKVPAGITGFAENAFADACITLLDMTECAAEVPEDLPGHIEVILREDY